ncbi:magnesium transporter MgtE [bacterium]|nr:magnesium transporter MgtE [bacterium]
MYNYVMAPKILPAVFIAKELTYHPTDRLERFRNLTLDEQAASFEKLSPHVQQSILEKLHTNEILQLLDHFDLQKAENVLARIRSQRRREKLAVRLKSELKEKAEYFLRFHPKAELHLLNFNYLLLSDDTSVGETADAIGEHYKEVKRLPEILVHKDGKFVGEVLFSSLVRENNSKKLGGFVVEVPSVYYQSDLKEIIAVFKSIKNGKVVVLDTDDSVVGVIYTEEALELLGKNPGASLYNFAGVADAERAADSVWSKVSHRYKWLIINLATGFLAASVVSLFENVLDKLVLLAIYMPIVAGMGGNASAQSLAVMVRSISVGEIELKNGWSAIRNEVLAGLINGLLIGILVAVVAYLLNQDYLFGLVIGVAMVINLVIAGFFGALVPLLMKYYGKDPATSATIFITTATDVFGFLSFLGLASIILL